MILVVVFLFLRYFSSRLIDHNGGQITLNDIGIKLIIPKGALPVGATEAVYIALTENSDDLPHLEEGLSLISPVITCGPHGLKFQSHVMLVFPHCAAVQRGIDGFQSKIPIDLYNFPNIFKSVLPLSSW